MHLYVVVIAVATINSNGIMSSSCHTRIENVTLELLRRLVSLIREASGVKEIGMRKLRIQNRANLARK